MKILFISPDIEEKPRGINMILKSLVESAKSDGHEVGLLVGYPHGTEFDKSEVLSEKLEHLQLQHYINEGKKSFQYISNEALGRKTKLKALLSFSAFKSREIPVNKKYISVRNNILNSTDFIVKSPYFYQLLNSKKTAIPQTLAKRVIKNSNIDMIIMASPSILSNKKLPAKVAHFIHDTMPIDMVEAPPDNNGPKMYAKQFYSSCMNSDVLFTNSKDTAKKVFEINPKANVHVLYGTASQRKELTESSTVISKYDLKKKSFLLFTSTIEKRKNVSNLLDAYVKVSNKIDMPLVIVGGNGYGHEEIHAHYESMSSSIKKKILFLGYVSEADKYSLYNNAFAFVFPSLYEGIGLMLIEAMQSGLPVITSRKGALPEAGGEAAYYIEDPRNVSEIADAITTVVNDPKLVSSMIKKGHKQQEKFTPERFTKRFSKALKSL